MKLIFKEFLKLQKYRFSKLQLLSNNGSYTSILPVLWMILFFILPILLIFKTSFTESIYSIPPLSSICSWTSNHFLILRINFDNYIHLVKDSYYLSAFINSMCLTLLSTAICFVLGFVMAYGICQTRNRTRSVLMSMLSLLIWTATLIRIYAWINLLSNQGLINKMLSYIGVSTIKFIGSYYTVCLGLVFCYLPYMIFPIYSILEKLDKAYIEAAYDLGCNPIKTFLKVTLPLCRSGIVTGCIMVFSTSIGEFVIPELLGGPDTLMFGRILWMEFFNNLNWPMTCALSIVMMAFIITPIYVFQKKHGFGIS